MKRTWLGCWLAALVFCAGCPIYTGSDDNFSGCIGDACGCEETRDCRSGYICVTGGSCVPEDRGACRANADCALSEFCDADQSCQPTTTGCTEDNQCGSGNVCDFRGTCVPEVTGACRGPQDCSGTDQCIEGVCRGEAEVCQFNYECGAGKLCTNSTCVQVCTSNEQCGSGLTCEGGQCRAAEQTCGSSTVCGAQQSCVAGQCLDDCNASGASCPNAGDYCAEDGFCRPDWRPTPFCTPGGNECAPGHECVDGACRTPCPNGTDAECMMFDSQLPTCGPMNLCYASNEITPECKFQSECDAGQDCIDAICR